MSSNFWKKMIQDEYKYAEKYNKDNKKIEETKNDINRIVSNFSKEVDDFLKEK